MNSLTKKIIDAARALGFTIDHDLTGSGHLTLTHPNGRYVAPGTPSDWRSARNAIAALERIAGQKLPRTNHRRSRKSFATKPDPQVEASRRRHAKTFDATAAERETKAATETARRAAAAAAAASDRRVRAIEQLMR